MIDIGSLLNRVLDQLGELHLRVAELEADLIVERQRRAEAERKLDAKIESESSTRDAWDNEIAQCQSSYASEVLNRMDEVEVALRQRPVIDMALGLRLVVNNAEGEDPRCP
jgi:hypothetical protein